MIKCYEYFDLTMHLAAWVGGMRTCKNFDPCRSPIP